MMRVSEDYNLALQQARINELPEHVRIELGALMLRGWKFTLTGSSLNGYDTFVDLWSAKHRNGLCFEPRALEYAMQAAKLAERAWNGGLA